MRPDEAEQHQHQVAELGREAKDFKISRLGQSISNMLDNQESQLIEELVVADPQDWKEIQRLQNEIQMRRLMPKFIDEAIQAGQVAIQNLDAMDAAATDY